MHLVDFGHFRENIEERWGRFVAAVQEGLLSSWRSTLVQNFTPTETNSLLLKLAHYLGKPHGGYSLAQHPLEDELVFRVEVRGDGINDPSGSLIYSTTYNAFPCHTDGANRPDPYDIILMLCVEGDEYGGESMLITLDQIVERLNADALAALREETYPFHFGKASIISGDGSGMSIRYNLQEINHYRQINGLSLSARHLDALGELEATIKEVQELQQAFHLKRGDCLVIDNKRALHGRTVLPKTSKRLLKRVRLYLDD